MLLADELPSSGRNSYDSDSLTDVSILTDDRTLKSSQLDKSIDDLFFQSLINYANSFTSNETVYSIENFQDQLDSTRAIRRRSSTSTALVRPIPRKAIPTYFFVHEKLDDDNSDENTTVTDQSKFQWEQASDLIDYSKKSSSKISSLPISIREKTKDIRMPFFRSPTPIIVREFLPKPSLPNRSTATNRVRFTPDTFTQHSRSSKPPVIPKSSSNQQPKKIIIEYDQLNIKVNKNIQQRKEIQRVHPNEYVQQYGSSLYSSAAFHDLFTNIIS